LLSVEIRLARQVPDTEKTRRFVDELNHWSFHGRWVHDPASATVALVADLDLDAIGSADPIGLGAVLVATMIGSAEALAYRSRPERSLEAVKALTLVGGRRRNRAHPVAGFVGRDVIPRGKRRRSAGNLLPLVQDHLVPELLGWTVEHGRDRSVATRRDGLLLTLRLTSHPGVGYGLMIAAVDERSQPASRDCLHRVTSLNRALQGRPGLGGWARVQRHLEHRAFLPNVLLDWLDGDGFNPWLVLALVSTTAGQVESPATMDGDDAGLMKPAWPGDDESLALARRDPINDGEDAPDTFVWLDALDRPAYTTKKSLARWRERLTEEDLADARVRELIDWLDR
jgi:hypothetical protein